MAQVFEGDEWKQAREREASEPTRADEQARVNAAYALGVIGLATWRERTTELSDLQLWCGAGRLKKP